MKFIFQFFIFLIMKLRQLLGSLSLENWILITIDSLCVIAKLRSFSLRVEENIPSHR